MADVILRATALRRHFAGRLTPAVAVDALALERGELFALVGPSGAGKSTLLRMLGLLERPDSGWVAFGGARFDARARVPLAVRRRVVYAFQRPHLLSQRVFDNVAYGLRVRGQRVVRGPVMRALERVGMSGLAHAQAATLSAGEAQRVTLARAAVIEPELLLLDEPTANLDPRNVGAIEEIVRGLNRDLGCTVLMVTHDQFQARRLAQRVGLMMDGEMVEHGPTREFFSAPRDPRTAAFVRGDLVW